MRKIPTIFIRDSTGKITREPHPAAAWVFAGEGVATQKYDGTCCIIHNGKMFKRRELKTGQEEPAEFQAVETDAATGKKVGWMPVGDGAEDRWHREAFARAASKGAGDGLYELCGPKIQGNPEQYAEHVLVSIDNAQQIPDAPREFDNLAAFLAHFPHEGVVWHHPDGRMAKIKRKDFARLARGN